MNCAHIQGMAEDEGQLLAGAEISQPVPAKDALHPDDDIFLIRGDEFEKKCWIGINVLVKLNSSLLIENADIHFSGMEIDSAIILVLTSIEVHQNGLPRLKV